MFRSLCLFLLITLGPGAVEAGRDKDNTAESLRDAAAGRFTIGTAVVPRLLDDHAYAGLLAEQFDSVTAENAMKPSSMLRGPGRYDFAHADRLVAFAEAHGMEVIGHTLVWHSQSPAWLYEDDAGDPLPREKALANMKAHIYAVVGHFKGRVRGWDVVNEAVPDGPGALRDTPALRAIGPDYVIRAFEFAHAADPDAELYYNDYNIERNYKRGRALELVKSIRDAGVRIDAVGIQGHFMLGSPSIGEIGRGIGAYTDAGFDVMITELDVDPLPRGGQGGADVTAGDRGGADPYTDGLPERVQRELADRYRELFELFVNEPRLKRVTFWGLTDGQSWLNGFPVRGRTNHPLLFDRSYEPKPAFDAVLGVLQGMASESP